MENEIILHKSLFYFSPQATKMYMRKDDLAEHLDFQYRQCKIF